MSAERRQHVRQMLVLECSWSRDARLTDLSLGGCYVDTRAVPALGEEAEVGVTLDGEATRLRGKVVHATRGLGFALKFDLSDDVTLARVEKFLRINATRNQ